MVPVPKGNGNSRLEDNNRGITIGCSFAKLYEKMLVKRWAGWANQNGVIGELQGANQRSCSSLHSSWLLREAISYNIERQSTVKKTSKCSKCCLFLRAGHGKLIANPWLMGKYRIR